MRLAVVGHVEWVEFLRVARLPASGEIVHALDAFELAAGGGAVAAAQLARLGGATDFLTALAEDELGRRAAAELAGRGIAVHAAPRPAPQRRAVTFLDGDGERTITVIGERLVPHAADALPWGELTAMDAIYFTGGDAGALRAARAARVLVATPRAREALLEAGVELDALVLSARDPHEQLDPALLTPAPRLVVRTDGARGGSYARRDAGAGSFPSTPLPGPVVDAYGCGDSFAAGLTFGLGAELALPEALELAARCGAACLTGRGPYAAQLTR